MGFIKAFTGSITGTFADQWLDYYMPRNNVSSTAALFQAVPRGRSNGRGENTKGNDNIITNGSKIIVPEGTALITIQEGAITGFIAEPGGFIFKSDDVNSQTVFEGDEILSSFFKSTLEKFKFGGQSNSEQLAFYINLKEIPNNKFGTQSEIYWDDAYFGTQVGALTRGTYTLQIVDPLLFISKFVPTKYLRNNAPVFDFADMDNDAGEQLFNEVVSTLSAAFSNYTNDPNKGNRISNIQRDQIGFAKAMAQAVEDAYQWRTERGLEIVKTAIIAIEYDKDTKELMKDVKKADALMGARGNSFMQQSVARGIQNGKAGNMAFMGMGINYAGGMMGQVKQEENPSTYQSSFGQQAIQQTTQQQAQQQQEEQKETQQVQQQQAPTQEDPVAKLLGMKKLLDAGAISQEEYDAIKAKILGV